MRAARTSWAVATALALSGCSFIAVRGPPSSPPPPGVPLECTQSRTAPSLDTAGAIVTPVAGLATWWLCEVVRSMNSWGSEPADMRCRNVLWATLGVTAAYTGSALYGFHETGGCRRLAAQAAAPKSEAWPSRPLPPELAPAPR